MLARKEDARLSVNEVNRRILGGLAAASLLLLSGRLAVGAFSQPQQGEPEARPVFRARRFQAPMPGAVLSPRVLRELNVSESQKEQLRAARQARSEELREARDKAFESRHALHQAIVRGEEEVPLRHLAESLALAEGDLAVLEAALNREMFGILTADQWQKLEKLRAEEAERLKERIERMRERRQELQDRLEEEVKL